LALVCAASVGSADQGVIISTYVNISGDAGEASSRLIVSTGGVTVFRVTGSGDVYANRYYGDGSSLTGLAAASLSDGSITSAKIAGLTITNANISNSAAINVSKLGSGNVTNTEFGYLAGITSAIQTQLSGKAVYEDVRQATTTIAGSIAGKQDAITGAATSIASSDLTANRALLSDASGKVSTSAVSNTELGYLGGVTSAIQTQMNTKAVYEDVRLATTSIVTSMDAIYVNVGEVNSITRNMIVNGEVTQGKLASDAVTTLTIADGNVTLQKMAIMDTARILGRNTAGLGLPEVLSTDTVRTMINAITPAQAIATVEASTLNLTGYMTSLSSISVSGANSFITGQSSITTTGSFFGNGSMLTGIICRPNSGCRRYSLPETSASALVNSIV